jgi:hypothetical protein
MRSTILIVALALACLVAQSNAGTLKGDKIRLPMEDYYQAIKPSNPTKQSHQAIQPSYPCQPRIARLLI